MEQDIGKKVQNFYNKTPFPDYELGRFNDKEDLELATYEFAQTLDRSIPAGASVIDIGTGTGQLSAYLSLRRKNVWGIDFSDSSLGKAIGLKKKLNLTGLTLKKINIMDPAQIESIRMKFDYLLCMGVLHHTEDAYRGFRNILHLLKPGGYVALGLYNTFGRLPLKARIFLAKTIFRNNNKVKDYFIKLQIGEIKDKERARGWWNDQYLHPHETTHSVGEVLRWFRQNGIEYHQSVPSLTLFDKNILNISGVWNKTKTYPNPYLRFHNQLKWIMTTHREGGYWITFGRKIK